MTLKMTTAQVVETSVTVTNSSFQNYTHPDDHTTRTRKICVVCQAGGPCEPLRKGKECSVEKAIRAAEHRRDKEVLAAMFANYNFNTKYIGTRIIMHYVQANKVFGTYLLVIV